MFNYHRLVLSLVSVGVLTLPLSAGANDLTAENAQVSSTKSVMFSDPENTIDLGLVEALRSTLTFNPAVKSQETEILAQDEAIDAAKASWYPNASGSLHSDNDQASYIEIEQPLWTFGKNSSAIEAAKVQLDMEKKSLLQIQRDLMEETVNAYTSVQSARLKMAVAVDNVAEHENLYNRITHRHQLQLASTADVNLAHSRMLQAKADLLNYQAQLQSALNELFNLTRKAVHTEVPVDISLLQLPSDAEVKRLAKLNNADVSTAIERVNLANADLKQQQASPYPTLALSVQQNLFGYNQNETYAGVTFKGSVEGLGLTAYNQVQGAEKSMIAAQYNLDSVRNDVTRETQNYLVNISLQKGLRDSQAQTVMALEKTMESFLRQYEVDRKTWVEVLNQQRELSNMRYTLIDTDRQYMTLSLQLSIKIGHLDEISGVEK